jgi:hypothetical protein
MYRTVNIIPNIDPRSDYFRQMALLGNNTFASIYIQMVLYGVPPQWQNKVPFATGVVPHRVPCRGA